MHAQAKPALGTEEFDQAFRDFLVAAKVQTYAAVNPTKTVLDDGAIELSFRQGDLSYRDRYYGGILFHGQEVVFLEDKPIWSMVYYGYTPDAKEPSAQAIDLLKLALRKVPTAQPYRGPNHIELDNLVYECRPSGNLGCFEGEETIKRGDALLIRLVFAGGWIL
jgi:hypothetical protein